MAVARKAFQFSLVEKGLVLLALPVLVQIILTIGLLALSIATRVSVTNSVHETASLQPRAQYALSVHAILEDVRAGLQGDNAEVLDDPVSFSYILSFGKNLALLREGWSNAQPMRFFAQEVQLANWAASPRQNWPQDIKPIEDTFRRVRDNFLWMAESERQYSGRDPTYRSQERHFWGSLLSFLFSAHVVRRLAVILDNSARLARKEPLNKRLPGGDEIAQLDATFHAMAKALEEATRAQTAMVSNASNLILTISEQGRILFANEGCAALIGYSSKEITGMYLPDLIAASQQERTVQALKAIVSAGTPGEEFSFETTMLHKEGRPVDTLWSGNWSSFEKNLFCVVHEISARKAAERLQQEVIQVVSRGLLNPLMSVQILHERLASGQFGILNEKGRKTLSIVGHSTQRMLDLIDDLLAYQRAGEGTLVLNLAPVDLNLLLNQSAESMQILANEKGVRVEVVPTDIQLSADGHRLMQILINLLSNALKYTPKGRKVTVSARELAAFVRIQVSDEGIGIPPDALAGIFDRFRQVTDADAKEHGGSGIGLAICKMLVQLHGGRIDVASVVGQGTTFSIYIPNSSPASLPTSLPASLPTSLPASLPASSATSLPTSNLRSEAKDSEGGP
jgi:PAS domain S-box-containing protein